MGVRKAGSKERLDTLLVNRGLVSSRERAQSLILAGKVLVEGSLISKVGTRIFPEVEISLVGKDHPYVGRGGVKLEGALKGFKIKPSERIALDVGASTGGFTDCLLQNGARCVYALDVGYGQLAWSLRNDPRVVVLERTHIQDLNPDMIPCPIDLVTVDVSFISLKKVIPKVMEFLKEKGEILALIKPQFEIGKGLVEKGGIIRSEEKRKAVIKTIWEFFLELGLNPIGTLPSSLKGQKGNQEYFIYAKKK